jgi:fructose/tagatose bisphosphate aldolase
MNIDTDMQYAYTRAVADHMFRNYDGVLKNRRRRRRQEEVRPAGLERRRTEGDGRPRP